MKMLCVRVTKTKNATMCFILKSIFLFRLSERADRNVHGVALKDPPGSGGFRVCLLLPLSVCSIKSFLKTLITVGCFVEY